MAYSDQEFEDELRNKLSNDAPLPPGMDWEAMRQGVKKKVVAKRKAKRPLLAWWWPGIGVALLLLAGVIGYQLQRVSDVAQSVPLAEDSILIELPNKQVNRPVDATGIASDVRSPQSANPPNNNVERRKNLQLALTKPQQKLAEPAQCNFQTDLISTLKDSFDLGVALRIAPTNPYTTNDQTPEPGITHPRIEEVAILPFQSHAFTAEGDFLLRFKVSTKGKKNEEEQEKNKEENPDSIPKPSKWFIDILAGTQFANAVYRGGNPEYAALRSETEAPLPGHHLSISLVRNISKKWNLRTGLAYDRIRTLTNYESMRTFDSTFQSVPIRIAVNGDTILGSADLQVRESRKVRSFQREQRLVLPLLLGRNFQLGKNSLAVRVGPEFGLLIGSGGKVLTAEEGVRSLSNEDFKQLKISARLEGELSMPLGTKGPLLIGRVGFRRVLGGGPAEVQLRGNSIVGGLGLRLPLK